MDCTNDRFIVDRWIHLVPLIEFNSDGSIHPDEYEKRPLISLVVRLMEIVHEYYQDNEDQLAQQFVNCNIKLSTPSGDQMIETVIDSNSYFQLVFRDPSKPTMNRFVLIRMLQLLDEIEQTLMIDEFVDRDDNNNNNEQSNNKNEQKNKNVKRDTNELSNKQSIEQDANDNIGPNDRNDNDKASVVDIDQDNKSAQSHDEPENKQSIEQDDNNNNNNNDNSQTVVDPESKYDDESPTSPSHDDPKYPDAFNLMFEIMCNHTSPTSLLILEMESLNACRSDASLTHLINFKWRKLLWKVPVGEQFNRFIQQRGAVVVVSGNSTLPLYELQFDQPNLKPIKIKDQPANRMNNNNNRVSEQPPGAAANLFTKWLVERCDVNAGSYCQRLNSSLRCRSKDLFDDYISWTIAKRYSEDLVFKHHEFVNQLVIRNFPDKQVTMTFDGKKKPHVRARVGIALKSRLVDFTKQEEEQKDEQQKEQKQHQNHVTKRKLVDDFNDTTRQSKRIIK